MKIDKKSAEKKPEVKKPAVKTSVEKKAPVRKIEKKPTAAEKKPADKKIQVKLSPKPKIVEYEEEPPKEKAAVETKEDIRMNLQVEKDLDDAKTKFIDLS